MGNTDGMGHKVPLKNSIHHMENLNRIKVLLWHLLLSKLIATPRQRDQLHPVLSPESYLRFQRKPQQRKIPTPSYWPAHIKDERSTMQKSHTARSLTTRRPKGKSIIENAQTENQIHHYYSLKALNSSHAEYTTSCTTKEVHTEMPMQQSTE